jgi:hypothetical protein
MPAMLQRDIAQALQVLTAGQCVCSNTGVHVRGVHTTGWAARTAARARAPWWVNASWVG